MTDVFSDFGEAEHRAVRAATAAAALAARDAARRAERDARDEAEATEASPAALAVRDIDLYRHAVREPGEPVSFAVVAALRNDETLRHRYARLVGLRAVAHSPMAAAAYSEGSRRLVGAHVLRVMTDDDGLPPILVISPSEEGVAPPTRLEAMGALPDGGFGAVRIALPGAIRGHVTLPLDPTQPDHAELAALLARPDCAIWLF